MASKMPISKISVPGPNFAIEIRQTASYSLESSIASNYIKEAVKEN